MIYSFSVSSFIFKRAFVHTSRKNEKDPSSEYTKKSVKRRCKAVRGWSVSVSIRKPVCNGMLYVEDEIRENVPNPNIGIRTIPLWKVLMD